MFIIFTTHTYSKRVENNLSKYYRNENKLMIREITKSIAFIGYRNQINNCGMVNYEYYERI